MIKKIYVKNFKCFKEEELELRNLTLILGTNSSGKSSIMQAIIIGGNYEENNYLLENYININIDELFNKYNEDDNELKIKIETSNGIGEKIFVKKEGKIKLVKSQTTKELELEKNLFYLSPSRVKVERISYIKRSKVGANGEHLIGYYELKKLDPIEKCKIIEKVKDDSLEEQLNYWLRYITDKKELSFKTQKIRDGKSVYSCYTSQGEDISPENIGSGINYLIPILILCLTSQKGNILIIENPGIHLHPLAQSRIGEFLSFIASRGVQIIVEIHQDHTLNRICYEEFKGRIKREDVILYYKCDESSSFKKMEIKEGDFVDEDGKITEFPKGFYDATLKELNEIERAKYE